MSGIFITYQREDSGPYAGLLYDELVKRFGDKAVFRDVSSIVPGEDFAKVIDRTVAESDAMLVLIGRKWLSKRLDDPTDFIRLEIESALAHNIRVIPVLVEDGRMPSASDLPEPLQGLSDRNAVVLTDAGWERDVARLLKSLEVVVRPRGDDRLRRPRAKTAPARPSPAPALGSLTGPAVDILRWALSVDTGAGPGRRLLLGLLLHDASRTGRHFSRLVTQHLLGSPDVTSGVIRTFLEEGLGVESPPAPDKTVDAASLGAAHLTDLVSFANDLAARTTPGGEVGVRHLVAALYIREPEALVQAGADLEKLGTTLRDALREYEAKDFTVWGDLLRPPEAIVHSWLAGYAADVVGGDDRLGVQEDVNMLCSVLAAGPPVSPPLSVGLFGDWGSGKSFFMELMRKRIELLAEASRRAKEAGLPTTYCSGVRQITFNAWHYADANLWASLVAEIFRQLAMQTEGDTKLAAKLEMASAQVQQAQARRDHAKAMVDDLESGIIQLEAAREDRKDRLSGFTADVADRIRSDARLRRVLDSLGQRLGVNADNVQDVRQLPLQARATLSAARRLWALQEPAERHRNVRKGLALVAGAGLAALFAFLLARTAEAEWVRVVTPLVPVILTAVGLVSSILSRTRKALSVALIERQLDAARKEKGRADQEVHAAEAELAAVQAGRRLPQFIHERSLSADYQQHLGLIALIRRDFELLCSLLLSETGEASGAREEGVPEIDRIILYIDDLDRCPADRVVEVLQAVHLLLALPLFVVVVGVDSRWLLRSLRRHYSAQLTSAAGDETGGQDGAEWASTPQSYLEKIFQIPFALRPMGATSYRSLARALLPASEPELSGATSENRSGAEAAAAPDVEPGSQEQQPSDDEAAGQRQAAVARPASPSIDLAPMNLRITPAELAFLEELHAFIPSPRAAKRLVNTYRLLRVSVRSTDLAAFLGQDRHEPQFPAVFLLLAVLVGFPDQAPELFDEVLAQPPGTKWNELFASLEESRGTRREWDVLLNCIGALATSATLTEDVDVYRTWVPRVARFSYATGRGA